MNVILPKFQTETAQPATSFVDSVHSHAYHGDRRTNTVINLAVPTGVAMAIIAGVFLPTETAQEAARTGASVGLACMSAYLSQTLLEIREKFNDIRKAFAHSAKSFTERQNYILQRFAHGVNKDHESLWDSLNPKKHPIRAATTALFGTAAAFATDPMVKMMAIYAGFAGIAFDMVAYERRELQTLSDTAAEAKRMLGYQHMYDMIQLSGGAPKHDQRFDG